jgi:hypothetical protein
MGNMISNWLGLNTNDRSLLSGGKPPRLPMIKKTTVKNKIKRFGKYKCQKR